MRDYSIFDQLTDVEFEGVKASVKRLLESDEMGMFGFITSKDMIKVQTNATAATIKAFVSGGLQACQGHNYKPEKTEEDK